ncbi:hypothetical protein [Thalassospira marina]|uniref:Uncharacterized protein n=1 Tax=Thalassospira marina TaxID=2048283 RepID=A0A2N3KY24_9PROT|nr:hypothetical protein [Thalassospira marina]PKR55485.1 hypothetical protein COO20_04765 [Thalassospira marina]
MPKVNFHQLIEIYRNINFKGDGRDGVLTIASEEILELLHKIETDDETFHDSNIVLPESPADLSVGDKINIEVHAPRMSVGLLLDTVDDFLNSPSARLREPQNYYIISDGIHTENAENSPIIDKYRKIIKIIDTLSAAASYVDETKSELIFIGNGKFSVPLTYTADTIENFKEDHFEHFKEIFLDTVHKDQKLILLSESIMNLTASQPEKERISFIIQNIDILIDEIKKGYRLFASSFSYAKIRSEIEAAKVEYISKIHKTFADIQGQLLGIPIAAVIIASQLKKTSGCDGVFWTNVSVFLGACIFSLLLMLSIINQWITLATIKSEVERQKQKLKGDYAAISSDFENIFKGILNRICWHKVVLAALGIASITCALIALIVFTKLTDASVSSCFSNAFYSEQAISHSSEHQTK